QGLADVCGTSNVGRSTLPHRLSVLAGDAHTMRSALSAWRRGVGDAALVQGQASEHAPRVAFLFPGQGPQYRGMGKALYDADASFSAAYNACDAVFSPLLGRSLAGVVFGGDSDGVSLDDTRFTQPAL